MGCGAAKSAIEVQPIDANNKPINVNGLNSKPVLKPIPRKDNESDRPDSTSSRDSGYADNDYKNVITEKSNPELIKQVEQEFKERQNFELSITGKGVPQLISNKEKQRMDHNDEMKSLEMLKNNGLVQTTLVKKENCVLFEIIDENQAKTNFNEYPNPNSRLAPLKKIPPRFLQDKDKNLITPEQISEKLERANQRKKMQTQLKLNSISSNSNINNEMMNDRNMDLNKSYNFNKKPMKVEAPPMFDPEVIERQKKLIDMRDRIRASQQLDSATPTPRTPRSQELLSELDKFRSKTPATFKAVFD